LRMRIMVKGGNSAAGARGERSIQRLSTRH